jgi:hypothetical protein
VVADPPLLAGAEKLMVACASPAIADTPCGAPGTVPGVTGFEAADAALTPAPLVAVTVQV